MVGWSYSVVRWFECGVQSLEPSSVTVMRRLEPGDPGVVNHKSPSTLLLDPAGQFHSFGFTARDYYHDLSPREARNWLYFDKFKMALHNTKVTPARLTFSALVSQCQHRPQIKRQNT